MDNDKDQEQERVLLGDLRTLESAEVQRVDRTVEWPTAQTESIAKTKAEEEARDLLKQNGADVLIWGYVERVGDKSAMQLYWTPREDIPGAELNGKYATETVALPSVFWDDLKQILGLLIQSRIAEVTDQPGRYVADKLTPLIAQVGSLVKSKEGVWNPKTLAGVQSSLAVALGIDGEQSGKNEPLAESIELYGEVLAEIPARAGSARLGDDADTISAMRSEALGERESGTARLEEAVAAYRAALEEWTRERVPLDWAETQNNLGAALARSASGRAGRRGSRRRSRPFARRWRRGRASGFRSTGRRRRTISAMRSRRSASGRAGRRGSRRRSRPFARRWRSGRASGFRSTGR